MGFNFHYIKKQQNKKNLRDFSTLDPQRSKGICYQHFHIIDNCNFSLLLAIHGAKIIPLGTFCLIILQPDRLLKI